jgi:hypothetical protein
MEGDEPAGSSRKFLMSKARTAELAAQKKWNETHTAKSPTKAPTKAPAPTAGGKKNATSPPKAGTAGISDITVVNIGDGLVPFRPTDPSTLPPIPKPVGAGATGSKNQTRAPAPIGRTSDINITQVAM